MIDKKLIPYGGLKKEPFSGTHHGMRYFFRGDDGKSSTTFTVFIYPEPWCFEDTPEEEKLPGFSNALKLRNPNG